MLGSSLPTHYAIGAMHWCCQYTYSDGTGGMHSSIHAGVVYIQCSTSCYVHVEWLHVLLAHGYASRWCRWNTVVARALAQELRGNTVYAFRAHTATGL